MFESGVGSFFYYSHYGQFYQFQFFVYSSHLLSPSFVQVSLYLEATRPHRRPRHRHRPRFVIVIVLIVVIVLAIVIVHFLGIVPFVIVCRIGCGRACYLWGGVGVKADGPALGRAATSGSVTAESSLLSPSSPVSGAASRGLTVLGAALTGLTVSG